MLRNRVLFFFALLSHFILAESLNALGSTQGQTPLDSMRAMTEEEGEISSYRQAMYELPSRKASFSRGLPSIPQNTLRANSNIYPTNPYISSRLDVAGMALGEPSPLVTYLLQAPISAERGDVSIWSYRLSLPQVATYPSIQESSPFASPLGFETDSLGLINLTVGRVPSLMEKREIAQRLYRHTSQKFQHNMIDYFSTSQSALMSGWERPTLVQSQLPIQVEAKTLDRVAEKIQDARADFDLPEIKYRYWYPKFETSVQLSQNYISDNWYKGGNSNLNLLTRTYFAMLYKRKKIEWLNELEHKLGIYSVDKNSASSRKYRISSDLIRLRSNYGLKAFRHVYYTIDAEAKTQLFNTYAGRNGNELQSSPFAPLNVNVGLGMKYEFSKKSDKVYRRKIYWSVNLAPLSFTYRSSSRDDIDLARHGLQPDKLYDYSLGSTLKGKMIWDINMNTSWESRIYFNTSYHSVEAEWENTLNMKIGKYFSTRLNLHLRFDDSARPAESWMRYLQINEILSFGFNYKL